MQSVEAQTWALAAQISGANIFRCRHQVCILWNLIFEKLRFLKFHVWKVGLGLWCCVALSGECGVPCKRFGCSPWSQLRALGLPVCDSRFGLDHISWPSRVSAWCCRAGLQFWSVWGGLGQPGVLGSALQSCDCFFS